MKVLHSEGKTSVVLDETNGNISIIQNGIWASFINEDLVVKAEGYDASAVCFKKKTETRGEFDGGLNIFTHIGSWDWVACALIPKHV